MVDHIESGASGKLSTGVVPSMAVPEVLMKSILWVSLVVLAMSTMCVAKDLPDAPSTVAAAAPFEIQPATPAPATKAIAETKTVDAKFVSLAVISAGSTFADSYTTLFARQNWLAGKQGVCNMEAQSAYLYGTHPTVGRAYAVASAKTATSIFAAYYLRKHHNRFWSAPLVVNSLLSLEGVTQNMVQCN